MNKNVAKIIMLALAAMLLVCCKPEEKKKLPTIDDIENPKPNPDPDPDPDPEPERNIDGTIMEIDEAMIEAADVTEQMLSRARAFRAAMVKKDFPTRNAVYIYSSTTGKYKATNGPEKLAARVAMLGFKDVYLSCIQSGYASGADVAWTRKFNKALHSYGIKSHALRLVEEKIYSPNTGEDYAKTDVNKIVAFNTNYATDDSEKFDGINADLEPHLLKATNSKVPSDLQERWDPDNGYGDEGPNNYLTRVTIERLAAASNIAKNNDLLFSEATFRKFQDKVNSKELKYGAVNDFLDYCECDWITVMAYSTTKETTFTYARPSLEATNHPATVSIAIKVTNNDDGDGLPDKGWNYLIETLNYLVEQGREYKSFRGIDFFQSTGLETMWSWLYDKGDTDE